MKSRTTSRVIQDSYLRMIIMFPLRPIRNQAECREATRILDQYFHRDDLDQGATDYVRTLAILVDEFDRANNPVEELNRSPLQRLKFLLDENAMTTADLGRLLGNSGLASQILAGRRQISKTHAKVLGKRFGLDAGTFI